MTAASIVMSGLLPTATASAATTVPQAIRHVWLIQLENESATSLYAPCSTTNTSYLDCTLLAEGRYLASFDATGHVSLDNYLSETSGLQGNPDTLSDCQAYQDYTGSMSVSQLATGPYAGQVATAGFGCVYPNTVQTLEDQLDAKGLPWEGLMEDMGFDSQRETATCGLPATAGVADDPSTPTRDDTQSGEAPTAGVPVGDQYAARHNPFVYFHSLDDTGVCARDVVPLGTDTDAGIVTTPSTSSFLSGLRSNLSAAPAFTWITPDLCDDGHDTSCAGPDLAHELAGDTVGGSTDGPGGLASINSFLSIVVPLIQASPAYREGGEIVIATDEGSEDDTSSCCGEIPGTTGAEPTGGGGLVGELLVSPFVAPGTSTVPYNHFSLLRTLEDTFAITTGGEDGAGHLAEASVAPAFGPDVYGTVTSPGQDLPEVGRPAYYALPLAGLAWGGLALRRRRRRSLPA